MSFFKRLTLTTVLFATAMPALGQTETTGDMLDLPSNATFYGRNDPNVRQATAQVNGEVITGTDIDQRIALLTLGSDQPIPPEQLPAVRAQILGRLIDETLQIQAAEVNEVEVKTGDVDKYYNQVARENYKMTPAQLDKYLAQNGTSVASLKRQIKADIAWNRLISRNFRGSSQVSDNEVKARIEQRKAEKGLTEYRLGEIYLSFNQQNQEQVLESARKIMDSLSQGANFAEAARKYSEASTAPVGGDLGWAKISQLPQSLGQAALNMSPGEIVPVQSPGGVSLLLLIDKRQIGSADLRDSVLSLKQIAVTFPAGTTKAQFEERAKAFGEATSKINGCGAADDVAKAIGAEIVNRDGIVARNLPGPLEQVMLQMQVGQSTPPYGSVEDGVRVFVLCGRDAPKVADDKTFDQILSEIEDERVEKRAATYLRDLRRDAIIDYKTTNAG